MAQAFFPMFVNISDKKIVIVGGGTVAARRVKTLLLFVGKVTVVSPELCDELNPLPKGVCWIMRKYGEEAAEVSGVIPKVVEAGEKACVDVTSEVVSARVDKVLHGADIVFAATNQTEVNERVYADCRLLEIIEGRKIFVNCADDKRRCDFFFPAVVQSGEITIGINSGGQNVKKVREVREKLDGM